MDKFAKAYGRGFTLRSVNTRKGRPTVGAERNSVLRTLVRAIQQKDFDGNLSALARPSIVARSGPRSKNRPRSLAKAYETG